MSNRGVEGTETFACKIFLTAREIDACAHRLLQDYGIPPCQSLFIYYLKNGERHPSKIAQKMGIDASNLSRMIRQLEEKKIVERRVDEANRTRVEILLTKHGRALAPKLDAHAEIIQREITRALSAEEQTVLARALTKVASAMKAAG